MVQDGEPELKRPRVDPPAAEAEAEVPAATEVGAPLLTADAAEGSPAVDSATTTSASADAASASADTASASADTAEAPAAVGQDPVGGNSDSQQPTSDATSSRCTGTVKQWRDEKGFGFITADDGSEDLFVHRTSLQAGDCLVEGAKVTIGRSHPLCLRPRPTLTPSPSNAHPEAERGPNTRPQPGQLRSGRRRAERQGAGSPSERRHDAERRAVDAWRPLRHWLGAGSWRADGHHEELERGETLWFYQYALRRCRSAPLHLCSCALHAAHATPHLVVSRRRATPASSATTEPDDGSEDVFVHRTSIQGADALQVSCAVKTRAQEAPAHYERPSHPQPNPTLSLTGGECACAVRCMIYVSYVSYTYRTYTALACRWARACATPRCPTASVPRLKTW